MGSVIAIRRELAAGWRLWAATAAAVFLGYHAAQVCLLAVRFGALPNYVSVQDWPANVARIIRSTPSVIDMASIIADEWLIEIGRMNYAFGHGISEWSFVVMPSKLAVVLLIATLVGADVVLIRAVRRSCPVRRLAAAGAVTAAGLAAGAASVTMTWVVCCAAPSWVVGLSVIGVGVTTALALAPAGPWLVLCAITVLVLLPPVLAPRLAGHTAHVPLRPPAAVSVAGAPP